MKRPHRESGRGATVIRQADDCDPTPEPSQSQLARLPRRLFRKLIVEPAGEGWRARIVGFDARWNGATSRVFASRHMALQAARAASRQTGLPVVTIETATAPDGPRAA
jgi:hypothetical protein